MVSNILISSSGIEGLGLISLKPIKKNTILVPLFESKNCIREKLYRETIWGRYINHSCKSNCNISELRSGLFLLTKKEIPVYTELTVDYNDLYFFNFDDNFVDQVTSFINISCCCCKLPLK